MTRRFTFARKALLGSVAALMGTTALTACNVGEANTSGPVDQSQVEAAQEFVRPFEQNPTSIGTDQPVSKAPSGSRTIAFLSCNVEVCIKSQEAGIEAAEAIGWEGIAIPFDGTPEDILEKVNAAIDEGVDGIAINGVPKSTYSAAFDRAEEAGIPIVAGAVPDEPEGPLVETQDGIAEFTQVGELLGNFIIADSEGRANAILFDMANFPIGQKLIEVAEETINENCDTCVAETVTTQVADIGTKTPGIIVSELQRNPDANYVVLADSVMATGVAPAIREAGLEERVKVTGANATSGSLANIENGSEYGYVQFSVTYFNWQAIDAFVRHFNGDPQIEEWQMPLRINSPSTIEGESEDTLLFDLPPDMKEQFLALWKVTT